jgi:hypothetical protein
MSHIVPFLTGFGAKAGAKGRNMGGYGSNRWGWQRTREDTDGLLWLDVRKLHKQGGLRAGAVCTQSWSRGGEPAGDIMTIADRHAQTITLDYKTRRPGEDWQPVREPIELDWTPCHYGGERPWFRCPRCYERRAVLYSVNGRFRCRGCHDLAYTSTRENELDRCIRRADRLRARLGDTSRGAIWRHPTGPKPAGMQWETYSQLREALDVEIDRMHGHLAAQFAAMDHRVSRMLDRHERSKTRKN